MMPTPTPAAYYFGAYKPEPADDGSPLTRWLTQTLDHVGHGLMLLTTGSRVLHANRLARQALVESHPLVIDAGRLRARAPSDALRLAEALDAAMHRGVRQMLQLGQAAQHVTVAVLPVEGDGGGAAVVSLQQPRRAQDLAVQCYARQVGFTAAETAVLEALLTGEPPAAIASAKGVALSTVRTQIGRLRQKTGAHSIRELLERMAALPPMMAVLQ